ncbi:DUF6777 domain-containing protein [Streptomyces huasconensis]|uniref:DUF6777 domain-containing protein n=1 Tax=Streptomyces huasconensis TaxID=1854574 RepID=UPI0036FC8711
MRASTRTYAVTFAISAALAAAGCSGDGGKDAADSGRELFMQPVAAQGPDPFTDSTARSAATPPPVTRSPQPAPSGSATPQGTRSVPGGTPGLYGGTRAVGSCDVDRQVRFLTADRGKARAFAQVSGIAQAAIPDYLRGLTPVVLRADTRVTNHGFRGGSATSFQSVLQAGTAVLVDARGLPRVRCACGNPLKPPLALKGTPRHHGRPWSGYEPTRVIVVTPAPRPVISIVIVNIVDNTWIERKTGDEHGDRDRVTKPPVRPTPTPTPNPTSPTPVPPDSDETPSDETPSDEPSEPTEPDQDRDRSQDPDEDRPDEGVVPTDPDTAPTDCPSPPAPSDTPQETPSALPPGCPSPPPPPSPATPPDGPSANTFHN